MSNTLPSNQAQQIRSQLENLAQFIQITAKKTRREKPLEQCDAWRWFKRFSVEKRMEVCTIVSRSLVQQILLLYCTSRSKYATFSRHRSEGNCPACTREKRNDPLLACSCYSFRPAKYRNWVDVDSLKAEYYEHVQASEEFIKELRLFNTTQSCDTIAVSQLLLKDVDRFLALASTMSSNKFLSKKPSFTEMEAVPWGLAEWGIKHNNLNIAGILLNQIELQIWKCYLRPRVNATLVTTSRKKYLEEIWNTISRRKRQLIVYNIARATRDYIVQTCDCKSWSGLKHALSTLIQVFKIHEELRGPEVNPENWFSCRFLDAVFEPHLARTKLFWAEKFQSECSECLGASIIEMDLHDSEITENQKECRRKKNAKKRRAGKLKKKKKRQEKCSIKKERELRRKVHQEIIHAVNAKKKARQLAIAEDVGHSVSTVLDQVDTATDTFPTIVIAQGLESTSTSEKELVEVDSIEKASSQKHVRVPATTKQEEENENDKGNADVSIASFSKLSQSLWSPSLFPDNYHAGDIRSNNNDQQIGGGRKAKDKPFSYHLRNLEDTDVSSEWSNQISSFQMLTRDQWQYDNWDSSDFGPRECFRPSSSELELFTADKQKRQNATTKLSEDEMSIVSSLCDAPSTFRIKDLFDTPEAQSPRSDGSNSSGSTDTAPEIATDIPEIEQDNPATILPKHAIPEDLPLDKKKPMRPPVRRTGKHLKSSSRCSSPTSVTSSPGPCKSPFVLKTNRDKGSQVKPDRMELPATLSSIEKIVERSISRAFNGVQTKCARLEKQMSSLSQTLDAIKKQLDAQSPAPKCNTDDSVQLGHGPMPSAASSVSVPVPSSFVSVPMTILPPCSKLHWDVCEFVSLLQDATQQRLAAQDIAQRYCVSAVHAIWPRAQVQPYGSFATGLCLPTSDLDMVICLPKVRRYAPAETPGALEGRNAVKETWQQILARKLRSESWVVAESVRIIEHAPIPIITLVTVPLGDPNASSSVNASTPPHFYQVRMDISFSGPGHNGLMANDLVRSLIHEFPSLVPLVLVLKTFLMDRGFGTAYTGGLSSYALVLLVAQFLHDYYPQSSSAPPVNESTKGISADAAAPTIPTAPVASTPSVDFGNLLLHFFKFYGSEFDHRSTGISVGSRCFFDRDSSSHESNPNECQTTTLSEEEEESSYNSEIPYDRPNLASPGSRRRRSRYLVNSRNFLENSDNAGGLETPSSYQDMYRFDPIFIEDPLHVGNNVGRNCFRIAQITRAFASAVQTLSSSTYAVMSAELPYVGGILLNPKNSLRKILTPSARPTHLDVSEINLPVTAARVHTHSTTTTRVEPMQNTMIYQPIKYVTEYYPNDIGFATPEAPPTRRPVANDSIHRRSASVNRISEHQSCGVEKLSRGSRSLSFASVVKLGEKNNHLRTVGDILDTTASHRTSYCSPSLRPSLQKGTSFQSVSSEEGTKDGRDNAT